MKVSAKGVRFIAGYEGFRAKPYLDAVGVPTIGFGHTAGVDLHHKPLTRTQGEKLLARDLGIFERGVEEAVTTTVTQGQFDALVSFAFNVGLGAFRSSTLLKRVNGRQWWRAWHEFRKWDKAGGHALPGLTRRRRAEARMFFKARPRRRK